MEEHSQLGDAGMRHQTVSRHANDPLIARRARAARMSAIIARTSAVAMPIAAIDPETSPPVTPDSVPSTRKTAAGTRG